MKRLIRFFEFRSEMSDEELIQMIRSGNSVERCKNILVERYYDTLIGFLVNKKSTLGRDELGMIVNDTFVRAFEKLDSYTGKGSFPAWLSTVAYRLFLNLLDSRKKEKMRFPISDIEPSRESDIDDIIARKEQDKMFDDFSEYLTPREKEWLGVYRMGMTHPQISKAIGMDVPTSKWYKMNLIDKLKKWHDGTLKKRKGRK